MTTVELDDRILGFARPERLAPGNAASMGSSRPYFDELPDVLTPDEVAAVMGVTAETVTGWCSDRDLPHRKIGRRYFVRKARLQQWLDGDG